MDAISTLSNASSALALAESSSGCHLFAATWANIDDKMIPLLAVALTFLLALGLGMLVSRVLGALSRTGHLPPSMARRLGRVFWWTMGFVVVASVLQNTQLFEQAWAVLSAALVALAVGFVALWSVLSNAVCALLILSIRPFRMGDRVEILEPSDRKPGIVGRVCDLSLMFTTLEVEDEEVDDQRALLRVPNSIFFQKAMRVTFHRDSEHTTFFEIHRRASDPE